VVEHPPPAPRTLTLLVRRSIAAGAAELFDAWTDPLHLQRWWGPLGARCVGAEVDLRVGGSWRIGNHFEDGRLIWLSGEYERIERPRRLTFTWRVGDDPRHERVDVRFVERGGATEVIVEHTRIAHPDSRAQHERGWHGCLDGLGRHAAGGSRA
jgi:uncharacterized protein YndB with AHSA1/START domain